MIGIYLSGTGNTKHCMEKLLHLLDPSAAAIPLESPDAISNILANDTILLGYPTQFSNAPYMVRDFIKAHKEIWTGKSVLCMATMGAFSGDAAGCTARLLKKYGATILGGLHIHMPDSVCDSKLLKKSFEENQAIIKKADAKIEKAATAIQNGNYPKEGLSIFYHIAGLFGQRLWFYHKTTHYSNKLKVASSCTGCGLCSKLCPMDNLKIQNKKAIPSDHCTMCYRCISHCPTKSITLLGDAVIEQCRFEKYDSKH